METFSKTITKTLYLIRVIHGHRVLKQNCTRGIFHTTIGRTLGAQTRFISFVEIGFTYHTDFIFFGIQQPTTPYRTTRYFVSKVTG
jgi:hypothetical protein